MIEATKCNNKECAGHQDCARFTTDERKGFQLLGNIAEDQDYSACALFLPIKCGDGCVL